MPAPIPGRSPFTFRLDETTKDKAKIIARKEERNLNSQLEFWIKRGVEAYEREHGTIILEPE